ncbi:MAG: NUDIX hydrolase [Granulosicoccus sp.]
MAIGLYRHIIYMQTLVGIGVILCRNGKVLLGKRRGAHGAGTWALPGGHLDPGESIAQCAIREVMEETALELRGISHSGFTDDYFVAESRHYITLFVEAAESEFTGEPVNCEPDKCEAWHWFDWNTLPEPLFPPLVSLLEQQFTPSSLK